MKLNKEICKKCFEEKGCTWDETSEILWDKHWLIGCPWFGPKMQEEEYSINWIPEFCPYRMEHVVLEQKK